MVISLVNTAGTDPIEKKVSKETFFLNELTSGKVSRWVLCGSIFLITGAIAGLIAAGGLTGILYLGSHSIIEAVAGGAVFSVFAGALTLTAGQYCKIHCAYNCSPKEFNISGIKNTNNNCWLNSLLQVLLGCGDLKEGLKKERTFKRFIEQYERSLQGGDPADSQPLRVYLRRLCPSITSTGEYQDAHEPLTAILNLLANDIPDLKNELTTKTFYKDQTGSIKDFSIKEPNSSMINLPIIHGDRKTGLLKLLGQYFHCPQNFDSDVTRDVSRTEKIKYLWGLFGKDKIIKEKAIVEKRHIFLEQRKLAFAPKDLFFNIQRYVSDPDVRIDQKIYLDKKYFENDKSASYELDSFIININQAHYISYVNRNGVWFLCNDSCIKAVSQSDAMSAAKKAYIVHYKKL